MALKITPAAEPILVDTLTLVTYGAPGLGKTALFFTAERPLLLDFDRGVYRAGNRGDAVQVSTWADVADIRQQDVAGYKTIGVDTAGRALDALTADILANDAKAGRGGALSIQGYGILKSRFLAWTRLVRSFGLDVVLIAHMEEQRKGDETVERLDVQGGSKGELYKSADAMGRLYMNNGQRMLNFSPTDVGYGKNPGNLPPLSVPNYADNPRFLAGVLADIKTALNRQSAEATAQAAELAKFQAAIDACAKAADFDKVLTDIKAIEPPARQNLRRMLNKAVKAKGIGYDEKAGKFVDAQPKEQAA